MDFKKELEKELGNILNIDLDNTIEIPSNIEMGDFAFPCFRLAKELKKAPNLIAEEVLEKIPNLEYIKKKEIKGAYINFFVDESFYAKATLSEILLDPENYGKSTVGKGRKIIIDYSAPNIAKPFHVGHLRSTVIGNALYNIYNELGYISYGINYLGDWGTQFGKLMVAYEKWGDKKAIEEKGVPELNRIYVKFHEEAEKDDSLNDEARNAFMRMQNGDEEALGLWKWFKDLSLIDLEKTYNKLDMKFDSYRGESYYNDKMTPVVEELKEKSLLKESNGAQIVDLEEYNMPPCLILRSDGGTLYPTRDLAAVKNRKEEFDFHKCIYVTAVAQKLHFDQWFKVIELMGYPWHKDLLHVGFGLVSLDNGKLSTRKGHVILMDDILNESIAKTLEIINNNNSDLENKEEVAKEVGIGAVIFNDLYNSRIKDVVFSWDRILNFEGETGPYVQYTHARCASILNKIGDTKKEVDYSVLKDSSTLEVLKLLKEYPEKIIDSANKNEPYIISRHLVNIAQAFNRFYHENKVNVEDEKIRNARGAVVFATKTILKSGLSLLGIKSPEKM
ncbi:MAG: arginine--tRNA ligase [Lachnospirales bacterium]